jgi:preprotein translocase subunit SecE
MATKKLERPKKNKITTDVQTSKQSFSLDQIRTFSNEVKSEFNKIVWPTKKVTIGSTGVVIVLVFIISIYLGAVDLLVGKLVSYVLR